MYGLWQYGYAGYVSLTAGKDRKVENILNRVECRRAAEVFS